MYDKTFIKRRFRKWLKYYLFGLPCTNPYNVSDAFTETMSIASSRINVSFSDYILNDYYYIELDADFGPELWAKQQRTRADIHTQFSIVNLIFYRIVESITQIQTDTDF